MRFGICVALIAASAAACQDRAAKTEWPRQAAAAEAATQIRTDSRVAEPSASANPSSAVAAPGPSSPPAPSYYVESDLRALAAQVKPLKNDRLLVCGEAAGKNCVCVEPLVCEKQGNCPTYQENIDGFRRSLASKQSGRSVECRRAEIGACGSFRYFDFEGDIERREVRWFDASGKLVAQRNATDYQAYCGGKSRILYQGRLPRCEPVVRAEVVCGSAERLPLLPIEEVLRRRLKP